MHPAFPFANTLKNIVSTAMHLLYQHNYRKSMTFDAFLSRFGYSLL